MSTFDGKSILITGGTGSFGQAFVKYLLDTAKPRKICIFSRDEFKQSQMAETWPDGPFPVRYLVGDIRDRDRLDLAFRDIDYVVHAAALKQVDTAEYNPTEFVRTNIDGTLNVLTAAIRSPKIEKVIALSTDKACQPINLYGNTKSILESLCTRANVYNGGRLFAAVRYGNVVGSRGSVIPKFKRFLELGKPLTITSSSMTRFMITMREAIGLVETAFTSAKAGEILIPKIPSARILDIAEAVAPGHPKLITGLRPGEKLAEQLIAPHEHVFEDQGFYRLSPHGSAGFSYSSDTNPNFMSVEAIREVCAAL